MRAMLVPALLLMVTSPAFAQSIRLKAGVTSTKLSEVGSPYAGGSALGWTLGGDVQFGSLVSVAPGAHLQQLTFSFTDAQDREDNVGLRTLQVPVTIGVGLDLKVVSLRVFAGPTLTFVRSVGNNEVGLIAEDMRSTLLGGTYGVEGNLLFFSGFLAQDRTFSTVFRGGVPYGEGALTVTKVGVGIRF